MTDNTPEHISYGVIPVFQSDRGNEYLLLQNNGGYWGFPKGHPENGEEPKETAKREALEETGIEVAIGEHDSTVSYVYEQSIDGVMQRKQIVLFPVVIADKEVMLQSSEIKSHKWVGCDEAVSLVNLPDFAQALQRVENMTLS